LIFLQTYLYPSTRLLAYYCKYIIAFHYSYWPLITVIVFSLTINTIFNNIFFQLLYKPLIDEYVIKLVLILYKVDTTTLITIFIRLYNTLGIGSVGFPSPRLSHKKHRNLGVFYFQHTNAIKILYDKLKFIFSPYHIIRWLDNLSIMKFEASNPLNTYVIFYTCLTLRLINNT